MSKSRRSKILGQSGSENFIMSDCPFQLPKENLKIFHSMQDNASEEPYTNFKQYANACVYESIMNAIKTGINEALKNFK